jgi:FkbM family methyltransferase
VISNASHVISIGARRGEEIDYFHTISKDINVYLFEPDYKNYSFLLWKYSSNSKCHIYQIAISDKDTIAELHIDTKSHDSSSLKFPTDKIKQFRKFGRIEKVMQCRMDTWYALSGLKKVDLIWVDIQGNEKEFINGATEILKNTSYLYTEYGQSDWYENQSYLDDIIYLLHPTYEIVDIFPNKNHGGDILFKNRNIA